MITLKQFTGQNITPTDDATLYELFSSSQAGIIYGCNVTSLGANQLQVSAGRGMILGRSFVVEQETILADLAPSGNMKGRLSIKIDLGNAETPISFETQVGSALPDPTQEEINRGGSVYEMPLAEYNVDAIQVSSLKNVAPQIIIASPTGDPGTKIGLYYYTGNGEDRQVIHVGGRPSWAFVFPVSEVELGDVYYWGYGGMARGTGSAIIQGHAVTVYQGEGAIGVYDKSNNLAGYKHNLNASGKSYVIVWF